MWGIGEIVLYANTGLCRIDGVIEKPFLEEKREYYVLQPLRDTKSTVFVPTENSLLQKKMHKLLTKEEILCLASRFSTLYCDWQEHDKRRGEQFKAVIESGDREALLALIHTVREKKCELEGAGKKLRSSDETALANAVKVILEEFCHVLDKEETDIELLLK